MIFRTQGLLTCEVKFGKKLRMHDAGTKLPQTCLMPIMSELIHQVSPCNLSSSFRWPKKFFCRQGGYKYLDRHFSHLLIRSRDYPLKYQHEEPSLLAAAAAGKVGSEGKEKSAKVCRKRKLNSSRVEEEKCLVVLSLFMAFILVLRRYSASIIKQSSRIIFSRFTIISLRIKKTLTHICWELKYYK